MSKLTLLVQITIAALLACSFPASANLQLLEPLQVDHYLLHDACLNVLNEQVSWELYASIVYLNMGAYFDRPSVSRAGFGKFFRDQSQEEYEHASKIIEYVNKRNATIKAISVNDSPKNEWSSPKEALADAIKLEKQVYAKLQHIHSVADQQCNDAHLTDFLESYYFVEQVDSIKELQMMYTTLNVDDSSAASTIEYWENIRLGKQKDEL